VGGFIDLPPLLDGEFKYMAYRSIGHYELMMQLKNFGIADGYYYFQNKKVSFKVKHCESKALYAFNFMSLPITAETINCVYLDCFTPATLAKLLAKLAKKDSEFALNPIWLNNQGQNIIGFMPKATFTVQWHVQDKQLEFIEGQRQAFNLTDVNYDTQVLSNADIDILQHRLMNYQNQQPLQDFDCLDTYQNGFIGFVSYDLSAHHLANANHVQASATHGEASYLTPNQPQLFLGHYDIYLTYQHQKWHLHTTTEEAMAQAVTIGNWLNDLVSDAKIPTPKPCLAAVPA
jgi:anthranilate/para-aminobenzoate synthase component I